MTVHRAFVLGSAGIDRQWGYTALSRARSSRGSNLLPTTGRWPWSGRRPAVATSTRPATPSAA